MRGMLGALLALAVAGSPLGPVQAAQQGTIESEAAEGFKSNFVEVCQYSHRRPDDPVVLPSQPGKSHSHDFFANDSTNAFSNEQSMHEAGVTSTCVDKNDTAAYWVPTLYQNGNPVEPLFVRVYYRPGSATDFQSVKPFPAGLKVIAGDAMQQTPPAPGKRVSFWSCGPDQMPSPTPPTCGIGPNQHLRLHIRFPGCWDGQSLDSADHKSHLAYDKGNACPADHPVRVPQLSLIVNYPITGAPGNITLASGSIYSAHADFFNTWNQDALAAKVTRCLNAGIVCGVDRPNKRS